LSPFWQIFPTRLVAGPRNELISVDPIAFMEVKPEKDGTEKLGASSRRKILRTFSGALSVHSDRAQQRKLPFGATCGGGRSVSRYYQRPHRRAGAA
jgi:hypothetical protein